LEKEYYNVGMGRLLNKKYLSIEMKSSKDFELEVILNMEA